MGSSEKTGVEIPALGWLVKMGYTHLPGSLVKFEHRHLAPVLEDVLRSRLLALNPWLFETPGGLDAVLIELRKRVTDDLLSANRAFWEQVVHRSDIQVKDADGKQRSVRFFDAATPINNDFHVVDQYRRQERRRRPVPPRPAAVRERSAAGHHRMQSKSPPTG